MTAAPLQHPRRIIRHKKKKRPAHRARVLSECARRSRGIEQHPLGRVRRARANLTGVCPLTWKHCSPSNPGTPQNCLRRFCGEPHSGFPPPLGKSSVLLKCGICFSSFLIKLESRIEIIERRTVLTERRSLCPTENTFGGDPDGERKATRRARRPCLLNYPSCLRGRRSLPHRKYFRRGPRIAATCKRRLCRRIITRALPSSPAS